MRILFVCLGNICRSPMAEFLFRQMAEEAGLAGVTEIASAGTSDEEEGNPVYPPVRAILAAQGISCEGKRARQLRAAEYDRWDMFIAMEQRNLRALQRLFHGDPAGKCRLLLDLTDHPGDIADPWYSGDFDLTFSQIREGCRMLLREISAADQRKR